MRFNTVQSPAKKNAPVSRAMPFTRKPPEPSLKMLGERQWERGTWGRMTERKKRGREREKKGRVQIEKRKEDGNAGWASSFKRLLGGSSDPASEHGGSGGKEGSHDHSP